jgi:peptidoglycan/LPS O-acetylase OafA/YrhL
MLALKIQAGAGIGLGGTVVAGSDRRLRIEGLDLLRGFAILLVLVRHSWPEFTGGGGLVGVVAFFTLSGYLITGVLMNDLRRHGRVRYGHFYRNRAIRLLPALGFLLLAFVIVEGVLNVSGTRESVGRSLIVAATYTMNIPEFDHGSQNLSHLWTLANEEQFYLVWPLLLAFGLRIRKLRLVVAVVAVGLLLVLAATVVVIEPVERLYPLPTSWTIAMVVGAAAKLGERRIDAFLHGRRATIGALVGVVGLLVLAFLPDAKSSPVMYLVGGTLIGGLTVLLIWKLRTIPVVPTYAKPLLWLGTISYAAYLWNYPMTWWLRDAGLELWAPAAVVLTLLAATASWFVVEKPFNRFKGRLDSRARQRVDELVPAAQTWDSREVVKP